MDGCSLTPLPRRIRSTALRQKPCARSGQPLLLVCSPVLSAPTHHRNAEPMEAKKTHCVLLSASFFGRLGSLTRLSKAFLSSFSPAVILVPLSLYAVAGVIPRLRGWLRTLHLTLDAFFYDSPYGSSAL